MEVLTKTELMLRFEEIVERIEKGAIFIYPTDTIYGIGCIATNAASVEKIRWIKKRAKIPFSIWVPSVDWVRTHCVLQDDTKKALALLPGPYTIIVKLKDKTCIASNINPVGNSLGSTVESTIGIRLPAHWFGSVVEKLRMPIVTTSANKHNHHFMTSVENLDPDIEKQVEFMIYEGPKEGRPSKIINTVEGNVVER